MSGIRAVGCLALVGCTGPQHVLEPSGPGAARIAELWWIMFAIAAVVTVVTSTLAVLAVVRARRREREPTAAGEIDGRILVWVGGVAVPLTVVFLLVVLTGRVGTAIYWPAGASAEALTIEVVGHQFWWEVRYPQHGVTTANQIYMPVGEQVRFRVSSPDVIHSFWVPRLQAKTDMIPGRVNTIWMQADHPGLFRGICAEYCGDGHALMAFWVEALPRAEFEGWLARRTSAPVEPADPQLRLGREVFFQAQCHHCHAVPGAPLPQAFGEVGPDLSDFGLRRTIAAGTRPNNAGTLAAWIADPEGIKPGARMPPTLLEGERLQALLSYLLSLR